MSIPFRVTASLTVFAALAGGCATTHSTGPAQSATAEGARPGNIAMVEAELLTDPSNNPLRGPRLVPVTEEEQRDIVQTLKSLPAFSPNPYSGCHARAHVAFKAIEAASRGKAFKVWLLSGRLLSPALGGTVSYKPPTGDATAWDYHVASAFMAPGGHILVADLLVAPEPVPLNQWLSGFTISGVGVVTLLPGEFYLFNRTEVPALDPEKYPKGLRQGFMSRNVLSGDFFPYVGNVATTHDGAADLAVDALSAAFATGRFSQCEWKAQLKQSLELKKLASSATPPPAECSEAAALYAQEFNRWRESGL